MATEVEALIALHSWLNHPMKSGRKYTTYDSAAAKSAAKMLGELIESKGVERVKGVKEF